MAHKNKPSKSQHVVPKVYQSQWSFNDTASIYTFYKNEIYSKGEIRNAGNFLSVNNINSIRIENYNFLSEEGIDILFGCLNKKIVNGIHVNNKPSLIFKRLNVSALDFFNSIQKYSISEENGNLLNKKRKNILFNQIRTMKFTDIEDIFSKDIDNLWIDTLTWVKAIACKPRTVQYVIDKDKLVKYLLCQFVRNPALSPEIDKIIDDILSIPLFKNIMQHLPNALEGFKSHYRISKSLEFVGERQKFKNNPTGINGINKYYGIFNRLSYTFLVAHSESYFITSDSPITFFTKDKNLSNGIYFPITPKIMLYMDRLRATDIYDKKCYVESISLTTTKYINDIILKNAKQFIISNQEYLGNFINGQYNQTEWIMITDKSRYTTTI
jgi:hypothetical protein